MTERNVFSSMFATPKVNSHCSNLRGNTKIQKKMGIVIEEGKLKQTYPRTISFFKSKN